MQNETRLIVLDTNIWLSFLISKNYSQIDEVLKKGDYRFAFSQELIEEFIEVANRPKFKNYFVKSDLLILLESIEEYADYIDVTTRLKLCRDDKDNFLLSLSIDSKAKYLITGDKDLLDLKKIKGTEIITIAGFLKK